MKRCNVKEKMKGKMQEQKIKNPETKSQICSIVCKLWTQEPENFDEEVKFLVSAWLSRILLKYYRI